MTSRPTPDQIAPAGAIDTLRHYGYVIVHPDDVPSGYEEYEVSYDLPEALGWNACREHIFGGAS